MEITREEVETYLKTFIEDYKSVTPGLTITAKFAKHDEFIGRLSTLQWFGLITDDQAKDYFQKILDFDKGV